MNQQIAEEVPLLISRVDANQLIPSIESAYIGLQIQGKYLPKITSSIITSNYLLKVLFDEYYVPETEDVRIGVLLRRVKKQDVIFELMKVKLNQNQSWGIDEKHQPDKQWAVNVLKSIRPDSDIFKKYSPQKFEMKQFTSEQMEKIKSLDITQGKKGSVRRFFRVPKDKKNDIKLEKQLQLKKELEKKIERKKQSLVWTQKEILEMGEKMQQI